MPRRTRLPWRDGELQRLLVGAHRRAQATLGHLHVGERDRAAEHVGDVVDPLELDQAVGVRRVRHLEVAGRPGRQPAQGGGGAPGEVVVLQRDVERPPGVLDRGVDVAAHEGQPGAVDGDVGRQPEELVLVHDDHAGRGAVPASAASSQRSASSSSSSTPSKVPVDIRAPARLLQRTGRTRSTSSGRLSSQAAQRRLSSVPAQGGHLQLDQGGRAREVAAGHRVPDRLGPVAVLLVPVAGPPVQLADALRLLVEEPGLQDVGEQVVVAVPLAAVVQRDQEQVVPVEGLQHGPTAVLPGEGVAQGAVHPVEDGGLQQERLDVVRLALQDLLDEVVDDVAVVAREAGDEGGDVVPSGHRERGELERGDPALGALLQGRHVVRGELQAHGVVEVGRRLVGSEAQVGGRTGRGHLVHRRVHGRQPLHRRLSRGGGAAATARGRPRIPVADFCARADERRPVRRPHRTGRRTGLLEALDRDNLFLVPLDDRRQWYRYHHLFADVLQARLLDEQPDRVGELHRRASSGTREHGDRAEAIRHAMAGGDFGACGCLIELEMPALRRDRSEATLRGWLEALPDEVLRVRPVLCNDLAGALMSTGVFEGVEGLVRRHRALAGAGGGRAAPTVWSTWARTSTAGCRRGPSIGPGSPSCAATSTRRGRQARRALDVAHGGRPPQPWHRLGAGGLAAWSNHNLDVAHAAYTACLVEIRS